MTRTERIQAFIEDIGEKDEKMIEAAQELINMSPAQGEVLAIYFMSIMKASDPEMYRKYVEISGSVASLIQDIEKSKSEIAKIKNGSYDPTNGRGFGYEEGNMRLKDILSRFKKGHVIEIGRSLGIAHLSSRDHADTLCEKVANTMLERIIFTKIYLGLRDGAADLLERALTAKEDFYEISEGDYDNADELEKTWMVFFSVERGIAVPRDVRKAYGKYITSDIKKKRKQFYWFQDCIDAFSYLYGIGHIDILLELYNSRKGFHITKEEMMRFYGCLEDEDLLCVIKDDQVIGTSFTDKEIGIIRNNQDDEPFFYPEHEIVSSLAKEGYPSCLTCYKNFEEFLEKETDMEKEDIQDLSEQIYDTYNMGYGEEEVFRLLRDRASRLDKTAEREAGRLLKIIANQVPLMDYRGKNRIQYFEEVKRKSDAVHGTRLNDVTGLVKMPVRKDTKIYPNDPCPCGSGKKYKQCCGRK